MTLIAAGDIKPTGERIAKEAQLSVRTLWLNFHDLDTLYEVAATHVLAERRRSLHDSPPFEGDLATRISLFCTRHAKYLERAAPYSEASRLREPFSAPLREMRQLHIAIIEDDLTRAFAPELAGSPEKIKPLTAICTSTYWATLRKELHLEADEATEAMTRLLTLALEPR
ncbi:hypothetical protein BH09ACT10_BH09ACT10_20070 [soil metagenome]